MRAIFELAKRVGQGPTKIAEVAKAQAIPARFLEVILGQLKQAGFVDSQRGNAGGYFLVRAPEELSVGEVVRFVEGPVGPVDCVAGKRKRTRCPLYGDCVFLPMWEKVREVVSNVYDNTTFQGLADEEQERRGAHAPSYSI